MSTYSKIALSGSSHGKGILVAATSIGSGTTIHTASATTTEGLGDFITIFAANGHTASLTLVLGWGGTTDPDDLITLDIPAKAGLVLVVADLLLRNTNIVKASAGTANKISLHGYANRIS